MADKIIVSGNRRYDGEYDLDLDGEDLTTLEWRWIKKIGGYLPATLEDGWKGGDPDVFLALAVIAMRRHGKIDKDDVLVVAERLEDGATIRFVGEKKADADNPPAEAPTTLEQSEPSGALSSQTSDPPGRTPSPTGTRDSERSAGSVPATLVI